jgi:hypothetical protein
MARDPEARVLLGGFSQPTAEAMVSRDRRSRGTYAPQAMMLAG